MPWQINDAPRTLEAAQKRSQIRTLAARMKMHAANAKKHAVINVSLHTMLSVSYTHLDVYKRQGRTESN